MGIISVSSFFHGAGSVHTDSYDVLGRQTADAVTTLGNGVDGAVQRIDTAYDTQGNAYLLSSYASLTATTPVNQVQRVYNGLGQLITEYQEHGGAVNTSTSAKVQYTYTEMSGGNHSRLTSIVYPNGRTITYNYATGLANNITSIRHPRNSASDSGPPRLRQPPAAIVSSIRTTPASRAPHCRSSDGWGGRVDRSRFAVLCIAARSD